MAWPTLRVPAPARRAALVFLALLAPAAMASAQGGPLLPGAPQPDATAPGAQPAQQQPKPARVSPPDPARSADEVLRPVEPSVGPAPPTAPEARPVQEDPQQRALSILLWGFLVAAVLTIAVLLITRRYRRSGRLVR